MDEIDEGVYYSPAVFGAEECAGWIEQAVGRGFSTATVLTRHGYKRLPHIRTNERVNLDDPDWAHALWDRVQPLTPHVEGRTPLGLDSRLRFYRYLPGQEFKPHKDGVVSLPADSSITSLLTCLIYLNADFEGGATEFYSTEHVRQRTPSVVVEPERGALLMFRHERWHSGAPVVSGCKYVLRSDVFFSPLTQTGHCS